MLHAGVGVVFVGRVGDPEGRGCEPGVVAVAMVDVEEVVR